MLTPHDELKTTCDKITALDERREGLVQYRDRQIVAALASGTTWAEVQRITGLSLRGVQLAIQRAD